MRRSAVSQIVVIFLSCWLVICQGIVIWDGQFGEISAGLAGGRHVGDQAFRAYRDDFGWADADGVQIQVPGFLE